MSGSRALKGSSKSQISESIASSLAMAVFWRIPPDISAGYLSLPEQSPAISRVISAIICDSARERRRDCLTPKATFSAAVIQGKSEQS